MRIKVLGAGSIGNHVAHAASTLGWEVVVCDVDPAALARMRDSIYPSRYGSWNPAIRLCTNGDAPRGGFDVIYVGTPPDSHVPLALEAAAERPRAVVVEKPLAPPSMEGVAELLEVSAGGGTRFFIGYDHVVGRAAERVVELLRKGVVGEIETLDVEFREDWGGIFAAHPWLDGPADSYLGYWRRGGGAGGEHSHALNLWQYFAAAAGAGRVAEVAARVRYVSDGVVDYDDLFMLQLGTETGLVGRVVQDVLARPARKRATLYGRGGTIEWVCNHRPGADAVVVTLAGDAERVELIGKTRPDDFLCELAHVASHLERPGAASPIDLERGVETLRVLAAAHRSSREGRTVDLEPAGGREAAPAGHRNARLTSV